MGIEQNGSGASTITPPAAGDQTNQNPPTFDTDGLSPGQSVSYETHRRLLSEKKRAAEELKAANEKIAAHEKAARESLERELKEKEDFRALAELRQKELDEIKAKTVAMENNIAEARKVDSFLKTLNVPIEKQYWTLIDTSSIVVDPTTGRPDQMSVAAAVQKFRETYPRVVAVGGSTGMPSSAPAGGKGGLTKEEWMKLPSKEMIARRSEVTDL